MSKQFKTRKWKENQINKIQTEKNLQMKNLGVETQTSEKMFEYMKRTQETEESQ